MDVPGTTRLLSMEERLLVQQVLQDSAVNKCHVVQTRAVCRVCAAINRFILLQSPLLTKPQIKGILNDLHSVQQ